MGFFIKRVACQFFEIIFSEFKVIADRLIDSILMTFLKKACFFIFPNVFVEKIFLSAYFKIIYELFKYVD